MVLLVITTNHNYLVDFKPRWINTTFFQPGRKPSVSPLQEFLHINTISFIAELTPFLNIIHCLNSLCAGSLIGSCLFAGITVVA